LLILSAQILFSGNFPSCLYAPSKLHRKYFSLDYLDWDVGCVMREVRIFAHSFLSEILTSNFPLLTSGNLRLPF
jgi:hypothetical protein